MRSFWIAYTVIIIVNLILCGQMLYATYIMFGWMWFAIAFAQNAVLGYMVYLIYRRNA